MDLETLIEKYRQPENLARILRWFWLISLAMLVIGYTLMFFILTGKINFNRWK